MSHQFVNKSPQSDDCRRLETVQKGNIWHKASREDVNNTPHNFSYSASIAYRVDFFYSPDQRLKSAYEVYYHWILQNIEKF